MPPGRSRRHPPDGARAGRRPRRDRRPRAPRCLRRGWSRSACRYPRAGPPVRNHLSGPPSHDAPSPDQSCTAPPTVPVVGALLPATRLRPSSPLSADRAGGGRSDQLGVLGQHAAGVARRQRLPSPRGGSASSASSTSRSRVWAPTSRRIRSPSRTKRDRAAVDGLGRDVPDAQAGGAAGEAAVGEQQHVLAQARRP